jgi:zinc transport system substrate-binding protein
MPQSSRSVVFATLLLLSTSAAWANVKVMVSIKPIHSLVAQVMQGVGTPGLIVDGAGSPHTYSLKPSQAAELQQAQVVFWVGHELESFLEKPLQSLGGNAKIISLLDIEGLTKLPPREGNGFDPHVHEGEEKHDHEEIDGHIWLDPNNAIVMLNEISRVLSEADPTNADKYKTNAASSMQDLLSLESEIQKQMLPLKGKGFIVFHDAYHYFENRFGLAATGAISINPENPPGAAGIAELQKRISDGQAICIFSEPQFDTKLVDVLAEGTAAKSAVLDPLGARLEAGRTLYRSLMLGLATSLKDCLASP